MEFKFTKEELATMWYRDIYSVEAENEEEAKKLFIEACENNNEGWTKNIEFQYSDPLYETYNPVSTEDNDNQATIKIYDENYKLIWNNEIN